MRHIFISSVISLALLAGCDSPESTSPSKSKSKSGAESKVKSEPSGPVFKTSIQGIDMVQALVEKDLAEMELPGLVIQAPERAEIKKKSPRGFKLVAAGVNYSLTIQQRAIDPKAIKETFTIIDPKGELVVDEPDRLIFKRASGSHLFHVETKVGDVPYSCSTVATAADFSRSEVDQMITSCKTLAKKGA